MKDFTKPPLSPTLGYTPLLSATSKRATKLKTSPSDFSYPGGNFGNGALVKFSINLLFVLRSRCGAQRSSDCDARFRGWTFRENMWVVHGPIKKK